MHFTDFLSVICNRLLVLFSLLKNCKPKWSPGPTKRPDHQGSAWGWCRSKVKPGGQSASSGLGQGGPWPSTAMAELETSTVPSTAWAGTKGPGLSLHRAPGPVSRVW